MRWELSSLILLVSFSLSASNGVSVNRQCRNLLKCSIKQKCVDLPWLMKRMDNQSISAQMYNDVDKATDYGCIFTAGCQEECNECPLCMNSKLQVVEILGGGPVEKRGDECVDLIACATDCVAASDADINMINKCLRHTCAYHCFDGSCPKCSAFITRIFNQMCVSGNFKHRVKNFKGQCYEMFRDIVHAKFYEKFSKAGKAPAIG